MAGNLFFSLNLVKLKPVHQGREQKHPAHPAARPGSGEPEQGTEHGPGIPPPCGLEAKLQHITQAGEQLFQELPSATGKADGFPPTPCPCVFLRALPATKRSCFAFSAFTFISLTAR